MVRCAKQAAIPCASPDIPVAERKRIEHRSKALRMVQNRRQPTSLISVHVLLLLLCSLPEYLSQQTDHRCRGVLKCMYQLRVYVFMICLFACVSHSPRQKRAAKAATRHSSVDTSCRFNITKDVYDVIFLLLLGSLPCCCHCSTAASSNAGNLGTPLQQ